jgi:hypothetical protein
LDANLLERKDILAAARSALRALAHGLDLAETSGDPDLIATAGRAYFDALTTNGLTTSGSRPVDAFDQLMADISRAGSGASDPAPP